MPSRPIPFKNTDLLIFLWALSGDEKSKEELSRDQVCRNHIFCLVRFEDCSGLSGGGVDGSIG